MVIFWIVLCAGAHSHIRGLGLDDTLDPRPVRIGNNACSALLVVNQMFIALGLNAHKAAL